MRPAADGLMTGYEGERNVNTSKPRHFCGTRDQVLMAHAAEMIARTSCSQERFAHALNRELFRLVPERAAERGLPDLVALEVTTDGAAYLQKAGNWLKRVQRWLAGEVELPSWIEEAWVQALEPEYRERCINELASRYGLVGARDLGLDGCPVTAFGQLVARLGNAVEATGLVLADGKISEADLPQLPSMIEALLAVEGRSCELRRAAENVLVQAGQAAALRVVS